MQALGTKVRMRSAVTPSLLAIALGACANDATLGRGTEGAGGWDGAPADGEPNG